MLNGQEGSLLIAKREILNNQPQWQKWQKEGQSTILFLNIYTEPAHKNVLIYIIA